jgi:hypothetical protein
MKKQIEDLLKDHQGHHSNFQVENFIIGCSGDLWAQYKQALREIESRYEIVFTEREDLKVEKGRIEKYAHGVNGDTALKAILNRKIGGYEKRLKNVRDTSRELKRFVDLAEKLKKELGEITEERRYQLETESWKNKGIKMAAIDILATGRISNQTYDFIFSLPKESQLELFAKLSNKQPMALLGFEPDEIRAITKK